MTQPFLYEELFPVVFLQNLLRCVSQPQQGLEALDQALDADFELWPDFIEYDRELLANDADILALIEQHKKNQENQPTDQPKE